jgi:hypothetical protein
MGTVDTSILVMLTSYLSGRVPRDRFEDWFLAATWDASLIKSDDTQRLVRRIKLRLAEFLNGDWSEEELKANLASLVEHVPIHRFVMPGSIHGHVEISTSSEAEEVPVLRRFVAA